MDVVEVGWGEKTRLEVFPSIYGMRMREDICMDKTGNSICADIEMDYHSYALFLRF